MYQFFDASFFVANRQRLRSLFTGTAPIVITAHGQMQRNSTNTYEFRQDSNFWYLTGIQEPEVILVMDKNEDYLILPQYDEIRTIFDGTSTLESLQKISGISQIHNEKEGWKKLTTRLSKVKHVATLSAPQPYIDDYNFYTNPARAGLISKIKSCNAEAELLDLREHLMRMRVIKQPQELAAIQAAINITIKALQKVGKIAKYPSENYIEAEILNQFRRHNAHTAYGTIVAAAGNACTMHYVANNQPIVPGNLVLIDAGAEVDNYAADITRTYCQGEPSKRQRAVIAAVEQASEYGISQLQPGVSFRDAQENVRQFIGEKLRELGLIKSITKEGVFKYFPTWSHFLGLDVHDVGDYYQPMEPGMVMTMEPGIYIPEENIGVRIEDDILITPKGCKVLSKSLPRNPFAA